MVTLASPGSLTVIPVDGGIGSIVRVNNSSPSNKLSSLMPIANAAMISPGSNVILYGPES